ncbi:hypothetical protein ACET3Z_031727 [Daucus carota]
MIMVAGLQPLTSLYPNVVAKEDFLTPNKLAPFKNYSSQLAALDFKSCATARRCIRNDKFSFSCNYNYRSSSRKSLVSADAVTEQINKLTLRMLCLGHVLRRAEKFGYVLPTDFQEQALSILFFGCDCILHSQTGSVKTLAYLLSVFSVLST